MEIIFWPFKAVWSIIGLLFGIMGMIISAIIGLVFLAIGAILTFTVVGIFIGIPLMIFGMLLLVRAIF